MIAIIAATKNEVSYFLAKGRFRVKSQGEYGTYYRSKDLQDFVVAVGGIGAERAGACTVELISQYRPTTIVSTGFAGGVQPILKTGDVVLCDQVRQTDSLSDDADTKSIETGLPRTTDNRAAIGDCLTVPTLVTDAETKQKIRQRFNSDVIDMESYWVCKTAKENNIECIAVRVVLDILDQHLPGVAKHVAANSGSAVRYLAAHPTELPATLNLWRQVRKAEKALAGYLYDLATTSPHTMSRKQSSV